MKPINRTHLRRDLFYTFDIETTTLITGFDSQKNPIRNAIIWSGQFYDGTNYIQTRSLYDTIKRLKLIEEYNKEQPYKVCVVVHNLSYEFQFIKDFFEFENILCTSNRNIIAAETDQIVFRCSYFLSNMSLDKFLKNENVPEEYLKTNMDYLKERFPWTALTKEEEKYCTNDVIGLHLAMQKRINNCHNADINNLPLTSTGYVRKDCRKAINSNKGNRYRFLKEKLDKETFLMCHEAFRGGNTHANRLYVNKVVNNVGQKDERSEYPAELILNDFPTKFKDLLPFKQKEFDYYLNHPEKWALLFEVTFKGLRLKNPDATPVPYLSTSKCKPLVFYQPKNPAKKKYKKALQVDNGRILSCYLAHTTICEVDFNIIKEQYEWADIKISKVKVSKKKPIPKELKDRILKYYYDKTTLKQDENDPNFDEDIAYNYARAKELLNGIYGMHVTNPCKPEYEFDNELHQVKEITRDTAELLNEYYDSYSSFLSYQVGIWVTAYARRSLQEGINACFNDATGKSDLVYCDTDSCKYLNPTLHEAAFKAINEARIKRAEERGAYVDYNGKRYHLGIFDDEGVAKKFKTFGAKKYIYSTKNGFKITISGVPKKKGKQCIIKAIKEGKYTNPFELKKGFCFHGIKTTSAYMDHTKVHEYEVDGHKVYYGSNVAMYPNSYTLGLTYEFEILLDQYRDEMEV